MSEESMSSKYLDKVNKLYEIGMKNIKLQLKLLGTDFVVSRPKEDSKWKNVFGGVYSSDNTIETDYTFFNTRLVVNLNELRDVWSRNKDVIESYSDSDILNVGDELQYTRNKITYRFKIIQKSGYSESAQGIFVYVLSSIIETKDM